MEMSPLIVFTVLHMFQSKYNERTKTRVSVRISEHIQQKTRIKGNKFAGVRLQAISL